MDDIEAELNAASNIYGNGEFDDNTWGGSSVKSSSSLLPPAVCPERPKETGFHKTLRLCLGSVRDAMLHHRWEDAAKYISHYTHALEDTDSANQLIASEIVWRLGCEILHHHPNSKPEDIIDLYERMKNFGVKNFAKISLDHAFHLLVSSQPEEARRQLSIAESWRYGRQSAAQSQDLNLIRAYRGFLDYITWRNRRSTADEADHHDDSSNPEMHSYFRQASVTLKEVIRHPGTWDPFVLGYIDMLEFYNDQKGAEKVLKDYAYDKAFPANPNAHIYLYEFLKRNDAPKKKLMKVLEILQVLVPSHKLALEYCPLLVDSEDDGNLGKALQVIMDLLEYTSWKHSVNAWKCLWVVVFSMLQRHLQDAVQQEWQKRSELWLALHFRTYHAKKDAQVDRDLLLLKTRVLLTFAGRNPEYRKAATKLISGNNVDD
ncbi:TATA box-binding protein-associated factor RNA polymerase I subunit A [Clupea harengus]|uniref:TATA box-binding protein-associated factor RNA polymerase I subunit A n=1 Tax=Clupea harengus TaxID=7950 RepID=A0A6P8GG37_CLUHA|nr:TATA box-binding protein-associated factor RNA polymerase I subunit A [Clupea harengus]XP_031438119.1 TATA box-binding protein-associated factor RNA polymerase I subunit A [Clupea harengus]